MGSDRLRKIVPIFELILDNFVEIFLNLLSRLGAFEILLRLEAFGTPLRNRLRPFSPFTRIFFFSLLGFPDFARYFWGI